MEKNTLQKFDILALLHEFSQHELQLTVYRNTDIHFLHEVLQILEKITEFIERQNDVFSLNDRKTAKLRNESQYLSAF